jgi:hypothetical protein
MWSLLSEQFQPRSAIFRQDDVVSLAVQNIVEEIQNAGLIIDYKNFGHGTDSFNGHLFPARESTSLGSLVTAMDPHDMQLSVKKGTQEQRSNPKAS